MKHFAASPLIASLFLISGHAEDASIPAFFVLDESSGGKFDMQAWKHATNAWRGEKYVRTYSLGRDGSALQKARNDATEAKASENVVLIMTTTTPDRNSSEFRNSLAQLERELQTNPAFKGYSVLARWPMCALVQQGPTAEAKVPRPTMVFVLDHPQANAFCYPMVQSYFTTPPGPDGKRVAPISVDASTIALQAMLPPMKLVRKMLADKVAYQQRKLVERSTAVYARGEEIFIYAYFENVGRKDVGTAVASYEIGLDIEVRDRAGKVLERIPNAHTYKGDSPPPFPVSLDYFTNFITAGIAIHELGATS